MDNTNSNEGAISKSIIGVILIIIGSVILLFVLFCMSTWTSNHMNDAVIMYLLSGGVFLGVGINILKKGLRKLNQRNEKQQKG
ncbi:hypothetical protein KJ987_07650 [bacterium]|nr:hypothetical protein [bacterium]